MNTDFLKAIFSKVNTINRKMTQFETKVFALWYLVVFIPDRFCLYPIMNFNSELCNQAPFPSQHLHMNVISFVDATVVRNVMVSNLKNKYQCKLYLDHHCSN